MAFTTTNHSHMQALVDALSYDMAKIKTEKLGLDIINFGLLVDAVRDNICLLVVRDEDTNYHHICTRYEILGLSMTMAAEVVTERVREIVKFYPPVATVMDGADEYDDIMQAQEIMNAL